MIKTTSFDQEEIIENILTLHCEGRNIDLDPCYSSGNFYKNGKIQQPTHKFDIAPKVPEVKQANAESLPLESETINVIMFDPPFLATTGKSLTEKEDNNVINKRLGVYPNEKALHLFYLNAMTEFYRILKPGGVLIFKCQDKVSSGKQYFTHCFIYNVAQKLDFYPKDLFVLIAQNRIVADWQKKNQKHARKFHSYFFVFEKSNKKTDISEMEAIISTSTFTEHKKTGKRPQLKIDFDQPNEKTT